MRKYVLITAILFSGAVLSAPYIEYKRTEKLNPHSGVQEYIRAGYKYKNVWVEAGKDSSEIGYKWSPLKNFIIKGKMERVERKNKLETEIRYTFQ
jgi:hypothetical protein